MSSVLPQSYYVAKERIAEIIRILHQMSIDIGHDETVRILGDVRNRLNDPFMFVVVGEVKSGKSSFVNALLESEEEICKVAPSPMTDTIQQIVYGEEEEEQVINPYLKRIYRPIEVLKEIAIVDTPGTNTIIEHHQEITERFIPASDLIVFVFEAKNPYRQSAWDFFNLINEDWHKKIIFVLQQIDLMEKEDLEVNVNGVREMAKKKGMEEPVIFPVSAKLELAGNDFESGFLPLKAYISENITGGKAPYLKLESSLNTAVNFTERIDKGVQLRRQQLDADIAFRKDIEHSLNDQKARSEKQVDMLIDNLVMGFDKIAAEKREELANGLSFFPLLKRSIQSLFSRKSSLKSWLNNLAENIERDMRDQMTVRLESGVEELAEQIRTMVKMIDLKIRSSKTILHNDHEFFSDIAEKRSTVIYELQQTFSEFLANKDSFKDDKLFPKAKDMSPQVAAGSGLAIIGIILATVTQGAVFDITGGIVTALGLAVAGISAGLNKGKVLRHYDKEIILGRNRLEDDLKPKLYNYIQHLRDRIERHFKGLDEHLEKESVEVARLEVELEQVQSATEKEKEALKSILGE